MDELAKQYWVHALQSSGRNLPSPPTIHIEGEGWQLWAGENKINSPSTNNVYATIYTPITQGWWIRHGHLSRAAATTVDWVATGATMRTLPHNHRLWVTKTASHNCGVGTTLVKWKYQEDAKCPRCGHAQEDTIHVTRCPAPAATQLFRKSIRKVRRLLKREQTEPQLRRTLIHALRTWRRLGHLDPSHYAPHFRTVINNQTRIGWQSLFEGLAATEWAKLQQVHYTNIGSRRTGNKWIQKVLKAMIRTGRKQWIHRNDVKHNTEQPRHKECEELLHAQIVREYAEGPRSLLAGDKKMLKINLIHLIRKPLAYKKAWWANIIKAKQRKERLRRRQEDYKRQSQANSKLFQYMQGRIR